MELTQIKGDKVGIKIPIEEGKNGVESDLGLVADSKLAHFAEIEKEAGGFAKISTTHEDNNLKVNGRKIPSNQSKKILPGDTVSFGENRENIFAVHEKGEEIGKEDVKNHIEKSGHKISDEEFSDILRKLKLEEKLIRGLFIGLLTVSIFLTGVVFALNSQNNSISKKIYEQLNSKDAQIEELKQLIGENPNEDDLSCDPDFDENCESKSLDLFSQIEKLEEENKKLEEKISKSSDSESQKMLEEKIALLEEKFFEKKEAGEKINFDEETKLELSKIISGVVEEINSFKNEEPKTEEFDNSEIKKEYDEKISQLEEKISELQKNISGEELDFGENGEKVGQAVKILLNKIMELQKEIDNLK